MAMRTEQLGLIILSGGKSSRMGEDKAFLSLGEYSLIEWLIKKGLESGIEEIVVVTNQMEKYEQLKIKVVKDFYPGMGPLAGIHSGLVHSRYDNNFVVPCDMPFITLNLIHRLLMAQRERGCQVVVPTMERKFQPLTAIYTKDCIPHIEYLLQNQITKVIELYQLVKTCYVELPEDLTFFNINTPQDFLEAEELLKKEMGKRGE